VTADRDRYIALGAGALPLWLTIFAARGLYRRDLLLGGPREYAQLVNACTFGFAAMAVMSYFGGGTPSVSRGWLVATWPLTIAVTGAGRFAVRRAAYRLRRSGIFVTRAVIVGANAQAVALARQLDGPTSTGVRVVGFLDDYLPAGAAVDDHWAVLGEPSALNRLDVDEAIVVQHALTWESLHELMRGLANGTDGPRIRLAPTFFDLLTTGVNVEQRANVPVIALNHSRIAGLDAVLKTIFEYGLAILLLAGATPLLAWMAVRSARRGGRLFVYRRYVGAGGHTVAVPTLAAGAPDHAPFRRVIAKSPALLSVLKGDIALVGPRPRPVGGDVTVDRLALQSVKPGLTGPASVTGHVLADDAALALELSYVRDYSIWRDLQIVWQRAAAVVRPAGSPRVPTRVPMRDAPGPEREPRSMPAHGPEVRS
jgi:lipopolysaccharide/colanic/teichoic acid biosynthesis glycosyltransferase